MGKVTLTPDALRTIIKLSETAFPQEACGILAGRGMEIKKIYPVSNVLRSESSFEMEPNEQLRILMTIDDLGMEMIGHFHSHPHGPEHPSRVDRENNIYPRLISLIASREEKNWLVNAFLLRMHTYTKIALAVVDSERC